MRQIPRNYLYFFGIVILAFFIRLISLDQSFWLDEAAQAVLSTKPITTVNYAADFQPPLYYILINFWSKLGIYSEWFLRLPSVFFGSLTCGLTYIFFKKLFDHKTGFIAGLFLAISPYHLYYSQELRMYSLLTFLTFLSWILLYKKKWLGFALISTLAFYTHYFSFVNIFGQIIYIFLFNRKNVQKIFLYSSLAFLPFSVWISTLFKQFEQSQQLISLIPGWKAVSNLGFFKFIPLVFAKFTVGMIRPENKILYGLSTLFILSVFFFAVIILIKKYRHIKNDHQKKLYILLLLSGFFIPLAIAWVASLWIDASSVWRIQFILPFFYGIIAYAYSSVTVKKNLMIGITFSACIIFSSLYLFNDRYHREDWRSAVSYTDISAEKKTLIITEFNQPFVPIEWYSHKLKFYTGGGTDIRISPTNINPRLVDAVEKDHTIILYTYLFELTDPEQNIDTYLKTKGYKVSTEKDFRGVGIIKTYK